MTTLAAVEFDLAKAYATYVGGATQAADDKLIDIISKERKARSNLQQTKPICKKAGAVVSGPANANVGQYHNHDIR